MKIKLVIECNPVSDEEEAAHLRKMFADLVVIANIYDQEKLLDGFGRMKEYYSGTDSLPREK
jgi:hypothetical protein